MTPGRIALIIVLVWAGFCFWLAGLTFFNLHKIDPPERYLALGLGLIMLYMGGALIIGIVWPSKKRDPNAPIEIPPLDQVHGRTSYKDDSAWSRNVMIAVGTIFFVVSVSSARDQPLVLVFALVSVGVLAGAGVMIWRQIQYGRSRLELAGPARRGDIMSGVITTSGFAWTVVDREFSGYVEVKCLQTFRAARSSRTIVVAASRGRAITTRDGNQMTMRFGIPIPIVDTSDGRFSWNVQLETESPKYRATFVVDVA